MKKIFLGIALSLVVLQKLVGSPPRLYLVRRSRSAPALSNQMAPARTMTGDTVVSDAEEGPQSPASPTNTDDTLRGDAIIEIREEHDAFTTGPSLDSGSSVNEAPAQPRRWSMIPWLAPTCIEIAWCTCTCTLNRRSRTEALQTARKNHQHSSAE